MIFLILFIIIAMLGIYLNLEYSRVPNKKKLFVVADDIKLNLEYAAIFSVNNIATKTFAIVKKYPSKEVVIEYLDEKIIVQKNSSIFEITDKILQFQNDILTKLELEDNTTDDIIKILLQIWSKYSIETNYRRKFVNKVLKLEKLNVIDVNTGLQLIKMFL